MCRADGYVCVRLCCVERTKAGQGVRREHPFYMSAARHARRRRRAAAVQRVPASCRDDGMWRGLPLCPHAGALRPPAVLRPYTQRGLLVAAEEAP